MRPNFLRTRACERETEDILGFAEGSKDTSDLEEKSREIVRSCVTPDV